MTPHDERVPEGQEGPGLMEKGGQYGGTPRKENDVVDWVGGCYGSSSNHVGKGGGRFSQRGRGISLTATYLSTITRGGLARARNGGFNTRRVKEGDIKGCMKG